LKSIPAPSSASACFDHAMGVVVAKRSEIHDDDLPGCDAGRYGDLHKGNQAPPNAGQERGGWASPGARGFTVGDGAKIGLNAVVVKPVPAGYSGGNPARVIQAEADEA
jgi:serine O-acetyltransferase